MDVATWQARLESNFATDGVVGRRLLAIQEEERRYGQWVVERYKGSIVLMDSFQEFYIDTLRLADRLHVPLAGDERTRYYGPLLLGHAISFRCFRAAEVLLINGYPLGGFALLRDIKDRALLLGGLATGITTYERLSGVEALPADEGIGSDERLRALEQRRKKEEERVFGLMVGSDSGLEPDLRSELAQWKRMFHQEVHGGHFSQALEGASWVAGKGPLPVVPDRTESSIAMYLNRSAESAWMMLRTFPYLQLTRAGFDAEWAQRWHVLDESFRVIVQSIADLGKTTPQAVIRLIDAKFSFCPENTLYNP